MIFTPIIGQWGGGDDAKGASILAADLGLPAKNVHRWRKEDSIPAGWFIPLIEAARRRGIKGITAAELAKLAAERRVAGRPDKRGAR